MLRPSAANFSTSNFFLVLAWTRSPIFARRGGSLDLNWLKNPSCLRFVLTALNCSDWAKFVAIFSTLVDAFSIVTSLLSIRNTKFNKRSGTDAFCHCSERSPSNASSFVNRNLRTILAAFDNIIPSSCQVVCEHFTIALPTFSSTVKIINFPFLLSKSGYFVKQLFVQSCYHYKKCQN